MLEYLVILLLGVAAGVFTGVVPGIHPNTVIFSSLPLYFYSGMDLVAFMSFLSGMSVSHTFHDFLPAIFLGAPEAEAALSALPGAELAMRGRGLEAFDYTVLGGAVSVLMLVFATPFLVLFLENTYSLLEPFMEYVLMFFLFFIVFRSGWKSGVVAVLAGSLGLLSFSMNVNQGFVLVPVFAGLFAVPSVFYGLKSDFQLPPQLGPDVSTQHSLRGGIAGFLAGFLAGVFPGIGAAVSTSFLTPLLSSRKEFLAGMGGVNTSDILMSFLALYLIGKARSGASVALESIASVTGSRVVFLAGLSLVAVSLSLPLAFRTSRVFASAIQEMRIRYVFGAVLFFVVAASFFLTGWRGLLILLTSSFVGYAALLSGSRACCMAVLLVPAILFYAGAGIFI